MVFILLVPYSQRILGLDCGYSGKIIIANYMLSYFYGLVRT